MPQPDYVPLSSADRVRPAERLPPPDRWLADRPAEVWEGELPHGVGFGSPGPNLGYGLKLADRFGDRLELTEGEHSEDALAGCAVVGIKRASIFGRAPVIFDMDLAFALWGFLGGAPADLVEFRKNLFLACSHDYWSQRQIASKVPEETLRLTPAQVRDRRADWRSLIRQ